MNFVSSLASKVKGNKESSSSSSNNNNNSSGNQTSDQKWSEVGKEAKEALEDYQTKNKQGKNPDYKEVGDVAQKTFAAYKGSGGDTTKSNKDLAAIGKSIMSGFMGKKDKQ